MRSTHYIIYMVLFVLGSLSSLAREDLVLKTEDGLSLAATLWEPPGTIKVPAVILIHQGGSDRSEWGDMPQSLRELGFLVLAYDVRGHGASDKVPSINALFNDPEQAPKDVDAAIAFLKKHPRMDGDRIGILGSSIGSNLACMAIYQKKVKSAVAISGKTSAVRNLAGVRDGDDFLLRSIFHISSREDQDGKRAGWAKELYLKTRMPRQIKLVNGGAHGVSVFEDNSGLRASVYQWFQRTL